MEQFMINLYTLVTKFQPLTYLLLAICFIFCGILLAIPSEKTKEAGKRAIPWIVIGGGIILGAVVLAKEVSSTFVF